MNLWIAATKAEPVTALLWLVPAVFVGLGVARLVGTLRSRLLLFVPVLLQVGLILDQGRRGLLLSYPLLSFFAVALGLGVLAAVWGQLDDSTANEELTTGLLLVAAGMAAVSCLAPAVPVSTAGGWKPWDLARTVLFGLGASGAVLIALLAWKLLTESRKGHPFLLQKLRQAHLLGGVFWAVMMLLFWLQGWKATPEQVARVLLFVSLLVGLLQPWQRWKPATDSQKGSWGLSPLFLLWCWLVGGATVTWLMLELFARV